MLFTLELSRRLEGLQLCFEDGQGFKNDRRFAFVYQGSNVSVVALHPGNVRTEVIRNLGFVAVLAKIFYPFYWVISKNAYEGAQTSIFCAVDDTIPKLSGKYFSDCKPQRPSDDALDHQLAKRLWNLSAELVLL
jgi:retinol dehydrogenase-12